MAKHKKRATKAEAPTDAPTDVNQWAKWMMERMTGADGQPKNPAAIALGKLGGRKGGLKRAANLTAKRRSQIAKKAAQTRWEKQKPKQG